MAPLGKLRAPLLAACSLISRSDPDKKLSIRLVLVVDAPEETFQAEALACHLAREFGLEARVEKAERGVTVRLSRSRLVGGEVGVGDRGESGSHPPISAELRKDLEDLGVEDPDAMDVKRRW